MPVCYYCHYEIKEYNLQDNEPGDAYTIVPLNDGKGTEVAVCEACTISTDKEKVSRRR